MDKSILVVDDDLNVSGPLEVFLTAEKYGVTVVHDGRSADKILAERSFTMAILDLGLPDTDGHTLLVKWRSSYPNMPVIVMTGNQEISTAVKCIKSGAFDFLSKPVNKTLVLKTVASATGHLELTKKVDVLTQLSKREFDFSQTGEIYANSPVMKKTLDMAQRIASNGFSCVLLTGESGTGKGLLARTIHRMSARRDKPFVEVNCSAMPATLVESELFGHKKGAFTDAKENRSGVFEMADGGTLFLDEIGDTDLNLQAALLKVIEEQRFRPVGSAVEMSVDVAIIAATNQHIEKLVAENKFRSDLYYRLNVIPLYVPLLSERTEDIPALVSHFVQSYSRKYGKQITGLSEAAMKAVLECSWPGNVRELRNVIERGCLLARRDVIDSEDLSLPNAARAGGAADAKSGSLVPAMPLADVEKLVIQAALEKAHGDKDAAAEILGIHRTTLYRKLQRYKIESGDSSSSQQAT